MPLLTPFPSVKSVKIHARSMILCGAVHGEKDTSKTSPRLCSVHHVFQIPTN
jgi:hypothetical protein